MDNVSYWLIGLAVAFAAFLLSKLVGTARRRRDGEAWGRYREALDRAKRTRDRPMKAAAYRDAAEIALHSFARPNLAVSLARRADRLDPDEMSGLEMLVRAMTAADRLRALERLLWRKLKDVEPGSARHRSVFETLLALYEGALRDPDRAEALRALYRD